MSESTQKKECIRPGCSRAQHGNNLCWTCQKLEEDGEIEISYLEERRRRRRKKKGELNPSQLLFLEERASGMMPAPAAKWFGAGSGGAAARFQDGNKHGGFQPLKFGKKEKKIG